MAPYLCVINGRPSKVSSTRNGRRGIMAETTNIQMNTNAGTQNGKGDNMKLSMFLAPQFSTKTITMLVFAYLAMVTVILIMTAMPFDSATSLDLGIGPKTVSASTQTVVVEIPEIRMPAPPHIIVEPAN